MSEKLTTEQMMYNDIQEIKTSVNNLTEKHFKLEVRVMSIAAFVSGAVSIIDRLIGA